MRAGFEDFVLLELSAFLLTFVVLVAFVVVVFLEGELIPVAFRVVEPVLLLLTVGVFVFLEGELMPVAFRVVVPLLLLLTVGVFVLVVDTEVLFVFLCETDLAGAFVSGL